MKIFSRAHARTLALFSLALALLGTSLFHWGGAPSPATAAESRVETLAVSAATDATTRVLHYQGRLVDPVTDVPKSNGIYAISFRLYTAATGGTALWTESKNIQVTNGLFSTLLGDTTALDLAHFNGQDLYLGVTVGADPEAIPRQRIAYSAYALFAVNAETATNATQLNGQSAAFYRNASNLNAGTIADARIPAAITRDDEVMGIVLANDGAGSGLDADLLDGLNSTDFAPAAHTHDDRYYTKSQSDGRYVASAGPSSMSASSGTAAALSVTQNGTHDGITAFTEATGAGRAAVRGAVGDAGPLINSAAGVFGTSKAARGVIGSSETSDGTFGWSTSGVGVHGQSSSGVGVRAFSSTGTALQVQGNATVSSDITANRLVYNTPRTHYFSISGDTFKPRDIRPNTYLISGRSTAGTYFDPTSGGGVGDQLFAPVHLPHGATITGMTFYYYDASSLNLSATLFRHTTTGSYVTLTTITSSGSSGNGSVSSSPLSTVVNNNTSFYEVYVRPSSGVWSTAGADLRLIGVTISYTLSEAP